MLILPPSVVKKVTLCDQNEITFSNLMCICGLRDRQGRRVRPSIRNSGLYFLTYDTRNSTHQRSGLGATTLLKNLSGVTQP